MWQRHHEVTTRLPAAKSKSVFFWLANNVHYDLKANLPVSSTNPSVIGSISPAAINLWDPGACNKLKDNYASFPVIYDTSQCNPSSFLIPVEKELESFVAETWRDLTLWASGTNSYGKGQDRTYSIPSISTKTWCTPLPSPPLPSVSSSSGSMLVCLWTWKLIVDGESNRGKWLSTDG
jgi:hypothetical protein